MDDIRRIASRGAFDFRFGGSRGRAARFALYFASPRNTSRFTVEPGLWRAVPKFHNSENTGAGTPRAGSRGAGARWISRAHLLRPFADSPTVGLRVLFPSGNLVFSSFPPHRARPTAQLRPRYVSVSKQHVWLPPRAFEGSLPSFRERGASRFPSTHSCAPLRSILQRETLGVHSFRPGGTVGDGRRRRTCRGLCLWPSRWRRPRLYCRWSSWRWTGDLRCPRAVPTETRGRI